MSPGPHLGGDPPQCLDAFPWYPFPDEHKTLGLPGGAEIPLPFLVGFHSTIHAIPAMAAPQSVLLLMLFSPDNLFWWLIDDPRHAVVAHLLVR